MCSRPFFMTFMTVIIMAAYGCKQTTNDQPVSSRSALADTIEYLLRSNTLDIWYPRSVDSLHGGFITSYTYDFKPTENQDKMIVTQSRHIWTNAKAAQRYPESSHYLPASKQGFHFLKQKMWDSTYGGFFTLVTREGVVKDPDSSKTAYGNAFGIYGLAAYYAASEDPEALDLAKKAFLWLEKHSHDPHLGGYFQHLAKDGTPVRRMPSVPSTADTGYKDQNSSIHLLEAFTELYTVWPDTLVRQRLEEMLLLIRDRIVTPQGYLTLFLQPDWTPVSFKDSTEEVIMRHHQLDHVSFGHDVETAYLMLEAAHALGWGQDVKTLAVGKKMVDHALTTGWDSSVGGFYDEGYYFKDRPAISIIRDTKNWWAQAEGLNTLLLMADLYPDDPMNYYQKFEKLWAYTDKYLIDKEYGDWYSGGLDKDPDQKLRNKGNIWKAIYHHYRSMDNVVQRLRDSPKDEH